MVSLTRTVRFAINSPPGHQAWGEPSNTFAAYPAMQGLSRHYELDIRCRGEIDPRTGYFVNIKTIDNAVRTHAVPAIEQACQDPSVAPGEVIRRFLPDLQTALSGSVSSVRWRLSPFYSIEVESMNTSTALLKQQFEFAAAHRLHVSDLSEDENRRIFGKCNNPAGHGHNYRVEPCVEVPLAPRRFGLPQLEQVVQKLVINRFDHTHLNTDTSEFGPNSGVNPSVENIAAVSFRLLAPAIQEASGGEAKLRSVTVWETDKTSCTYPA